MSVKDPVLHSEYKFLLSCYKTQDIDLIISDLEQHFDGYSLLYIIDTYDIVENYLPYTEMELFSRQGKNFLAQKFICYDYFFGAYNKENSILLNEYRIELLAAKNKLNKHLRDARTLISNLETLKKETNDFLNDNGRSEEFFRENFEIILLLLILSNKSKSILDEFYLFIKDRLLITDLKMPGENSEKLNDIFANSLHSRFSIELFERYIEENRLKLLSIDNNKDRHIFLENTFRDIQVVERLLKINEGLVKSRLKYKVIYLSSAFKTVEIFKVLGDRRFNLLEKFPNYHSSLHRNIFQYFLFDRIRYEYKNDRHAAIEVLQSLKQLIAKISDDSCYVDRGLPLEEAEFMQVVRNIFEERSNSIDNHFYLSVCERYKDTFDRMIQSDVHNATLNTKEVIRIVKEVHKNKELYKQKIYGLEFSLSQLNQTYEMVDTFQGIESYDPVRLAGKDIIKDRFHHLPYLVLLDDRFNSPLKKEIYGFINMNIEFQYHDKSDLQESLMRIMDQLVSLNAGEIYSKHLRSFIITYLNLVAQSKGKLAASSLLERIEQEIISDFEKQFEINKYQFVKLNNHNISVGSKVEYSYPNNDLLPEIAYVLMWLYRRNNREEEGIEMGLETLKLNPEDPRIFHGMALCYISRLYRKIKNKEPLDQDIGLALNYLNITRDRYQQTLNKMSEESMSEVLVKNYIAVLNGIADLSVRKFDLEMQADGSLINTARTCIDEVKHLFVDLRANYEEYITYYATEMEIEYFEALIYYNNHQVGMAHTKIIDATSRSVTLRKLNISNDALDGLFLDNESRLNELNNKIIHHYGNRYKR